MPNIIKTYSLNNLGMIQLASIGSPHVGTDCEAWFLDFGRSSYTVLPPSENIAGWIVKASDDLVYHEFSNMAIAMDWICDDAQRFH